MKLPRQCQKAKLSNRSAQKDSDAITGWQRKKLSAEQTKDLEQKLHTAYGRKPYSFQVEAIKAQLEGTDILVHASTGAGKTTIAAGPHTWIPNGVTLITTPLIQLAEEMVETFKNEFGLAAVSIHSKNGALSPALARDILAGTYKVILASPEMMQTRSFIDRLLRNQSFTRRIISLFVDEAHCISHWGAQFRKKYATIGTIRAFLPANTPVVAVSATLTARVRRDIQSKLHFSRTSSAFINVGNNRPNISIVVRTCQNPMNMYSDLDFVLPDSISAAEDIPKTWVYVDDIDSGTEIIRHLRHVLFERNPELDKGIIRPYNARLSLPYRQEAMSEFRSGSIRILICTEAAGMGCNILDIQVVVQWKLPSTLSNFIQRAGRAARGQDREGLAVLLVEPSAYAIVLMSTDAKALAVQTRKAKVKRTATEKALSKEWALTHGVKRGGHEGDDSIPIGQMPVLDVCADDEGLLAFVQSVTCRRKLWGEIFECIQVPISTVPCCDICSPELLQQTRPASTTKSVAATRTAQKGLPDSTMQSLLEAWRDLVFERDHKYSSLDSAAILSDDDVVHLASVGKLTREVVEAILKPSWPWWNQYGDELVVKMEEVEVVFVPIPKQRKSKRSPANEGGTSEVSAKKRHTESSVSAQALTSAADMYASPSRTLADTSVAPSPAQAHQRPLAYHTPGDIVSTHRPDPFVTPPSYFFHPSMPSPMHSNTIPWHVPPVAGYTFNSSLHWRHVPEAVCMYTPQTHLGWTPWPAPHGHLPPEDSQSSSQDSQHIPHPYPYPTPHLPTLSYPPPHPSTQ
ncbi:P-loop containing nucleoside triphosphate hydrolase protein [Irpex rosettiformis]|uniref:P-loop containing nucleoside triphosphate hydrolase protein n=1 Tax=Irpex rosettiformis TaxID=378272 RepID=A0ACB8TNJ9_9APHY|nr:P-loop containing nucleoside triphosphate hydrolase protein [Irpex rosettiformis]